MTDAPALLIVAGPNGSGKSTLTRQLQAVGVSLGHYINPDDIAAALIGSYEARVREAQHKAEEQRVRYLEERADFSFETVMSHPSKIEFLKRARAAGYSVTMYVGTESPDLNIARVRQRVALGGHDVPEDRIAQRYKRTMGLLTQAIVQCDRSVLFDNSYRKPDGSARFVPFCELIRLAEKTKNGSAVFSIKKLDTAQTPNWAWEYAFNKARPL